MPRKANRTSFKPGTSGNPGGKPVGARNRVTAAFLNALAEDFEKHGAQVIEVCRKDHPDAYLRALVSLVPKEFELANSDAPFVIQITPTDKRL